MPGFHQAVGGLKVGESREWLVRPDDAYGELQLGYSWLTASCIGWGLGKHTHFGEPREWLVSPEDVPGGATGPLLDRSLGLWTVVECITHAAGAACGAPGKRCSEEGGIWL